MSDQDVNLNTKGLDQLIKALGGRIPIARVGILGDKDVRTGNTKANSNATIGAAHEFGTDKLPVRSFLRVPISQNLDAYLTSSGAFNKKTIEEVVKTGSLVEFVRKIGAVAETIVADAFATAGFGKWRQSDMSKKKNQQTLVETQQLRNSITSDVK